MRILSQWHRCGKRDEGALRRLVFPGRRAEYKARNRRARAAELVAGAFKMQRIASKLIPAAAMLALAAPGAAQNGSAGTPAAGSPPATTTAPPAAGTSTPPAGTTPPATTSVPVTIEPAQPVVIAPPVQAPPQPVTIQPDVAYPNGFADPADPFANDAALANRNREGYPWGLLGLFGLLGLIPLFRGNGRVRTIYVERDDPPRRVVRERIEEE
jgi:hypothetical protein